MASRGLSATEAHAVAAAEMTERETGATTLKRQNELRNIAKRIARNQQHQYVAERFAKNGNPDLFKAIQNQITAVNTPLHEGRAGAELQRATYRTDLFRRLIRPLDKAGLFKLVTKNDPQFERRWGVELGELSKQAAGEPANPGVTKDANALKVAQAIHAAQETAKARMNREGSGIADYAGWITSTSHNAAKIRRAGYQAWRDFIMSKLDQGRTFANVKDIDKLLENTYNGIVSGHHLVDQGHAAFDDPRFTGPGNLAEKVSAGRFFHFKDSEAWLDYQKEFGTGTLLEFKADIRRLKDQYAKSHPDAVRALSENEKTLLNRFYFLNGEANRPAREMWAQIGAALRTVSSMAHLGMVGFTHLNAIATRAAELRKFGIGWLERHWSFFDALAQGPDGRFNRDLADYGLTSLEGRHDHLMSQFQHDTLLPGMLSKHASTFLRLSGLTYSLNAHKSAQMRVMARHLGKFVGQDFEHLTPELKTGLDQYGITPKDWDTLRNAPDHPVNGINGTLLTPDAAYRSTEQMSDAVRDKLGLKLAAMYQDIADRGIITPGIEERVLFRGSAQPGTLPGEISRFIAQFKVWGAAAVRQGLGREIYGSNSKMGAAVGVMQLALESTLAGSAILAMKDVLHGKKPRPWNDARTWAAAMLQGGGAGILGDFLFEPTSTMGEGLAQTLSGPIVGGMTKDVMKLYADALGRAVYPDGSVHKRSWQQLLGGDLVRMGVNNAQFVNLFFARKALNYLFLYSLQESMDPGYLRRIEQNAKRRTGQQYILAPSQNHLKPFGR
jgi:hypothetical protein